MLFRVKIPSSPLRVPLGTRNILLAKTQILAYPFGASERILDIYLRDNFKLGLRECCLRILFNLQKTKEFGDEIVYVVATDYWDKIAQLITCGLGNIPGSRILIDSISGTFN
jgi:hypothetical protein